MRSRFLAVLATVAWLVAWASPSRAAQPGSGATTLYVLDVATEDADDQARALTIALKRRVRESKEYVLGDLDISLQVVTLALKCGDVPNTGCQAKIAAKIKAERYLWAIMKRAPGNQVQVDAHLWQANTDLRERFTYSDNLTQPLDPALERIADQIFERLVNYGKVGTVRVVAELAIEGELSIDGKPRGRFDQGARELTLPLGEHRFEVRGAGGIVASGRGTATAGQPTEVTLTPSARAPRAQPREVATLVTPKYGDAPKGDLKRSLGYVAVGAGAALIGAGLYASLKVNAFDKDIGADPARARYFGSFSRDQNACDSARRGVAGQPGAADAHTVAAFCGTAPTSLETLQYVFYGIGAATTAAGIYFVATAKAPGERDTSLASRIHITPSVGPARGSLDVRVAF